MYGDRYVGASAILNRYIENNGVKKSWIADKLGLAGSSLTYKLKHDTFTFGEVVQISYLLDSSGEILKYLISKEIEKLKRSGNE